MEMSQQHHMQLETTHPSGDEEWFCPACGRRFLMHWPPEYRKTVLEPGDEFAVHSGGKGGLQVNAPQVMDTDTLGHTEEQPHNPWGDWLADIDFGDMPDETNE